MSKPEHTPGPWTVRNNENGTLGIDAKETDGSYCQPARINGDAYDEVYGPVTRANARLIAAAPDLLTIARMAANVKGALAKTLGAKARAAIHDVEGT